MKIILNEQNILDKMLNEKIIDYKSPLSNLKILTKYYFNKGMNKTQVRDSIEIFMKVNYKGFNSVKWSRKLDELVKKIEKSNYELFVLDNIKIYNNELETIKNIKNNTLEKILFVLLVYSKIYNKLNNNNENWVNCDSKYIYSDCKLAINTEKQSLLFHNLKELGLIYISNMVNCTNVKLNYVNENGSADIIITDFRDFVYEYLKWKGEKIENCIDCNKLIRITSNRKMYCNECWKEVNKEQTRIRVDKFRKCNGLENTL